ncbi:MAG: carbohydrate binding family 9 domain-containing protein [candidate division KSB1 bacterium]|nr:carbohydrate binding family 9 domain-containing protein [candidate division KSB1 bacterium]MDZ7407012.1 carbohydrate binding family 9 domain-containing protein [candidate division KSB1 bacterium]
MLKTIHALKGATLVLFLLSGSFAAAQDLSDGNDHEAALVPVVTAWRVDAAPILDGEVLNDPAWNQVKPATGFWQTAPDEGRPATERTEVRVIYTTDTIYFGVVCYDRAPDRMVVSDSRRDSPLDETDSFQIILDTFHDKQNGFVFGTNPAGIEYDGQVTNEGQGDIALGGRQQAGSGGGFNLNWDASWKVRTAISDSGWSAEFAIPFRTLRYNNNGKPQSWGVNFQRNLRRRNETAFWTRMPRQFTLFRLSQAGVLQGLEISSQRNFKFMPYSLGKATRNFFTQTQSKWDAEFGGDLKYSLTPSLTLDATYNTDFAQVEVDEQQVNLERFNLFFPEKRPFFLENAGLFAIGTPGEVEIFFSRRIGISASGREVPIVGGGRLSGKIGATNLGLLNMQTEAVGGVTQANNFSVARVSQEFPNRSSVGAMFINREATGDRQIAGETKYNRTFVADARLGIGKYTQALGFVAKTTTPGRSGRDYGFKLGLNHDSKSWLIQANYTEIAENFNPEVGFLRRFAYRKSEALVLHRYRPQNFLGLHELRPHVSYRGFWDFSGFQETGFLHLDNHWEWKSGVEIHTGVNFSREGLKNPFTIYRKQKKPLTIYHTVTVPAGIYDHTEVQIVMNSNQGAPLSVSGRYVIGGAYGGERTSASSTVKFRIGETFNTELTWSKNYYDLPFGSFNTDILRARISYSFTPRLFVQSLLQYNDLDEVWSTNLRLGWLQSANTGLFVVYNENRDTFDETLGLRDRSFIVKFSRLFDLLE